MQRVHRPEANHDHVEALCYRNPDGEIIVVATNFGQNTINVSFNIAGEEYAIALKPHSFNTLVASR